MNRLLLLKLISCSFEGAEAARGHSLPVEQSCKRGKREDSKDKRKSGIKLNIPCLVHLLHCPDLTV